MGGCLARSVVELLGADTHHAIVESQCEVGTSCGQCVMDLSVIPLGALLKVVGLVGRGVHGPLSGGNVR